ncbi:MAG TPA: hypothetical protein VMP08_26495 [Anaerolineae bacterium]|nr:hypothetical protein [Anaerolineae bacterium]
MRHFICLMCVLVLAACTPVAPPAADLLPVVPTANVVEGQTLLQYQRSLKTGIADLREHPAEAQLLNVIDEAQACYKTIAGTTVRVYADKRLPLMSGFIAIANRRDLTDTAQFSRCAASAAQSPVPLPTFALCSHSYTMLRGDIEYEVAYVALSQTMCDTFCAKLPGCAAHY